jgi:hypothetical protein
MARASPIQPNHEPTGMLPVGSSFPPANLGTCRGKSSLQHASFPRASSQVPAYICVTAKSRYVSLIWKMNRKPGQYGNGHS